MRRRPLSLSFECPLRLEQLSPRNGGRERWCEGCQKTVYDLSKRTPIEVDCLVRRARKRSLCVAYRVDANARPLFARVTLDRVGVALATAALLASTGCMGFVDPEWEAEEPDLRRDPNWSAVQPYETTEPPQSKPTPQPESTPQPEPEPFELPDPEIVEQEPESSASFELMGDVDGVAVSLERRERLHELERRAMLLELVREAEAAGEIVYAKPSPPVEGD